jgi:pyruvate dehydrogenase E2 component (dihydrolipoamide acetyltransferase)
MAESLASTAQYTLNASADATGLLALRREIKASSGIPDITINDLVVFCAIQAVLEVPAVNAELIEGRLYQRVHVNLGFACDTPRGLVVPVVQRSEELSVAELSGRMSALATQAVEGTLGADDMADATFTVSNLGGLGVESFTPVINPPQVAILGVDAITLKPVRKSDGGVDFVDVIGLSVTFDHQVIDGAPGARFLNIVKQKIASVQSICSI